MSFIKQVYQKMERDGLVRSTEAFSVDYLTRSPSYYRSLKAQKRDAGQDCLLDLLQTLALTKETALKRKAANDNNEFAVKLGAVEKDVAAEIARHITRCNTICNGAVESVIEELVRIRETRQTA